MPFVEIIQKYSTGILPEVSRPTTKPFVVGRQMIFYRPNIVFPMSTYSLEGDQSYGPYGNKVPTKFKMVDGNM